MPIGRVVYAVVAASGGTALQCRKLRNKLGVVEEFNLAAVKDRQGILVNLALGLLARYVSNAVLGELFRWPRAGIPIALDSSNAVTLERLRKLPCCCFGT